MFTSLVRRHWTVEPSLTAMESWIPNQRCLWDNGEGCMHIFCRNCPKTLGTLREDMEFGQRQTLKKKNTVQITGEEHVGFYRTGDRSEDGRSTRRAKVRCTLPDRHPPKTEVSSTKKVDYKARNKGNRGERKGKAEEKASQEGEWCWIKNWELSKRFIISAVNTMEQHI